MPSLKRTAKGFLGRMLGGEKRPPRPTRKMVWRISAEAPAGEWVDPEVPNATTTTTTSPAETRPADVSSGGWLTSSMDLLGGAEVIEGGDTEAAPLHDEPKTLPLGTRRNKN
jgi:hypothetical protein